MRVSSRNPNKNKRKPTKVAATSKDIKKTPSKAFAKGFLYNKSSIMSSSKSCSDSTDESDREYEEIPYTTLKFKTKKQRKIFTFKCYKEEDLNFSAFGDLKPTTRTCDDDCSSDDERIQNAISKLYNSLLEKVEERKQKKLAVAANIKSKKIRKIMKNKKNNKSKKRSPKAKGA